MLVLDCLTDLLAEPGGGLYLCLEHDIAALDVGFHMFTAGRLKYL